MASAGHPPATAGPREVLPLVLTDSDLLRLLLDLVLLLVVARALGEMARRLGQPQVIGELAAGVLLGPSLLGRLAPGLAGTLFPTGGAGPLLLQLVAQVGVIFLLLLSGLEVDFELMRRKARPAVLVAAGGLVLPFFSGYGLGLLLPGELAAGSATRALFALFLATAMSISAVPVIVKILLDMDLMRRDVGQLTVAAGVLSDTAGWFLLAAASGMATGHTLPVASLARTLLLMLAFVLFCFTLGHRLLRSFVGWVDDRLGEASATLSAVVVAGLAGAAVTLALHVEAFLGAFLVGVQLARVPRVGDALRQHLQAMTLAVFAPVFFASAGLRVDLPAILTPALAGITLAVIATACAGKFLGTYVGARAAGLPHWPAVGLGAGMNARGAVEIIVATVGLEVGVLSVGMYSIIIIMAVATSVMAPPALRWSLGRAPADPEEQERLRREELASRGFLRGLRRMLVPVRDGRYALAAAEIVRHLARDRSVEAVALTVPADGGGRSPAIPLPAPPTGPSPAVAWSRRTADARDGVAAAIVAEAARGYDLVVLGAGVAGRGPELFGPVPDAVVLRSPCSVFVLREPAWSGDGARPRRILLPTTGTRADLRGAEFALALARGTGAKLVALHVVERLHMLSPVGSGMAAALQAAEDSGRHMVRAVASLGEAVGVEVDTVVLREAGLPAGDEIARYARAAGCDLILLAAEPRPAGEYLYCGRTVTRVVRTASCPVAVLFDAAHPGWMT
jgi:Kef-type K+ transport system membrane component KefB/nucleotide-binding universal stress UspA family protein